jgi:hypothetical protein
MDGIDLDRGADFSLLLRHILRPRGLMVFENQMTALLRLCAFARTAA